MDVKLPGMVYGLDAALAGVTTPTPQDLGGRAAACGVGRARLLERGAGEGHAGRDGHRQADASIGTAFAVVADSFEPRAKAGRNVAQGRLEKGQGRGFRFGARRMQDYVADTRTIRMRHVSPIETKGDVKAAFAGAAKTYKAEFRSDYGYHAQMSR